jgi:hypothetical protein
MRNAKLMTGVALAALLAGAPAAFALDVGNIVQSATQSDNVDNSGQVSVIKLQGDGSSASVSATGALSAVSVTGINSGTDDVTGNADIASDGGSTFINQTSTLNGGNVTNDGIIDIDNSGGVFGDGASASISATGAASAVGAVYINSTGNANFGNVTQVTTVKGGADISNDGNGAIDTDGGGPDQLFDPFDVTGDGASVSVSATGAVSSVGLTGINSNANAKQSVGNVNQTSETRNGSDVSNRGTGPTTNVDSLRGDGSSASISATGSASSVSIMQIGAVGTAPNFEVGNITQNTSTGNGDVTNSGLDLGTQANNDDTPLSGTGASASVSATGAVSGVSATYIESIGGSKTVIGNVNQTTSKGPGAVTNTGVVGQESGGDFILSGDASSISISATGAASAVSATFVNSGELDLVSTGNINQNTTNNSTVTNRHRGQFGGSPNTDNGAGPDGTVNVGNITGDAASVSVSATGAASSVSLTSINNSGVGVTPNVSVGNVNQTSTNTGDVINEGVFHNNKTVDSDDANNAPDSVINVGNISGTASSASISATGAIAALSVSTVNGTQGLGNTTVGNINQTATNSGSVSNQTATAGSKGIINAGSLTGSGTSTTVSATGAAASASFSAID